MVLDDSPAPGLRDRTIVIAITALSILKETKTSVSIYAQLLILEILLFLAPKKRNIPSTNGAAIFTAFQMPLLNIFGIESPEFAANSKIPSP